VKPRLLVCAALVAAALALPAAASAATDFVTIQQAAFGPPKVAALVGDTVSWHNGSLRDHTVTTADGSFGSNGHIVPGGGYQAVFNTAGAHPYYCQLHAGMTGEVDVYPLLLSVPSSAVAPGEPIQLSGRAAAGTSSVRIERDSGSGFVPVATAAVDGGGNFQASVPATTSALFRAVGAAGASQSVQVVVVDRQVSLRAGRRTGVLVHVTPPDRGATVVLQVWLRERFGWFPVSSRRLDRTSSAKFPLRYRGRRARAVLVLPDGFTPVAMSAPLRLPR
jgi:plastocyanin